MLQSEVVNKLAKELTIANGDFDHYQNNHLYIQMALAIGIDHFTKEMEEIVVLDVQGIEVGRYKSIAETALQIGLHEENISAVLNGRQHTSGGYMFIKAKDCKLVPRESSEK